MKIVHVSDLHVTDGPIHGSDPNESLRLCLSHVTKHHPDADLVAVTGDLTHWGEPHEYAVLKDALSEYDLPLRLMIGNHDSRENFQSAFPDVPRDANGFVQYAEDVGDARCLFLDTVEARTHAGHFGRERQSWLRNELARAHRDRRDAYLFMHHNPTPVGIAGSDTIGLVDGEPFRAAVAEYRDTVRHIFFGHCHYVLSGSIAGVPFSAPRSINHPCIPDFSGRREVGMAALPPTYNVVLIRDGDTVIHSIDFKFDGEIAWFDTTYRDRSLIAAE